MKLKNSNLGQFGYGNMPEEGCKTVTQAISDMKESYTIVTRAISDMEES